MSLPPSWKARRIAARPVALCEEVDIASACRLQFANASAILRPAASRWTDGEANIHWHEPSNIPRHGAPDETCDSAVALLTSDFFNSSGRDGCCRRRSRRRAPASPPVRVRQCRPAQHHRTVGNRREDPVPQPVGLIVLHEVDAQRPAGGGRPITNGDAAGQQAPHCAGRAQLAFELERRRRRLAVDLCAGLRIRSKSVVLCRRSLYHRARRHRSGESGRGKPAGDLQ